MFSDTLSGRETCQRIHPESGTERPSLSLPARAGGQGGKKANAVETDGSRPDSVDFLLQIGLK